MHIQCARGVHKCSSKLKISNNTTHINSPRKSGMKTFACTAVTILTILKEHTQTHTHVHTLSTLSEDFRDN